MNRKYWSIIFIVFCLALTLTACSSKTSSAPSNMPNGTPNQQQATQATVTETATEAATNAATATSTATVAATATAVTMPATPVISFYCLKTPDENSVGVKRLVQGTTYTALSRTSSTDYFLIQYSDNATDTCWAWKNYITIEGNGYTLPVVTTATN